MDLNYCSFNIEDFAAIFELYKDQETFNKFKGQDLLLIQEWKNTNQEGDTFINKLNENNTRKYEYKSEDRVAVIYDSTKFDCILSEAIELAYEEPKSFEKMYTTGRKKNNILVVLRPKTSDANNPNLNLCIVDFHLSAYKPDSHPGFHKRQLSNLLKDSLKIIGEQNITDYAVIIGGDTNYRNLGKTSNNLLEELIDNKEIPNNGVLRDVCEEKCLNTKTQSFSCTHEKGIAKSTAKFAANMFNKPKDENSSPSNSLEDNRLDFIATTLKTDFDKTTVVKVCSASDHSAIFAESDYKIDDLIMREAIVDDDKNLLEDVEGIRKEGITGSIATGGTNKTKNKKTKNKKTKNKKNKGAKKTKKNKRIKHKPK